MSFELKKRRHPQVWRFRYFKFSVRDYLISSMAFPQLNYHHLRLFWEVTRTGSLRAAAQRMHLTEPTVSAQIKILEKSLGKSLLERASRGLVPTSAGKLVADYAAEIFSLGTEMMRSLDEESGRVTTRLNVGITDSLPKLVAWRLIRPALQAYPGLQLSCAEGHIQELLGQLASGRLDVVLSDEPVPTTHPVKTFSHRLGDSPVVFCGAPSLAGKYGRRFPKDLTDAPVLLPSSRTAWRHEIDHWFDINDIQPRLVAEFDDAALMKTAAADGLGLAPIAELVLDEAVERYGLKAIGKPVSCGFACNLITLDRSMRHPALALIAKEAKGIIQQSRGPSQTPPSSTRKAA